VRARRAANRFSSALYDVARFTTSIEAAWQRMMEISHSGRPPESFTVPA